MDEPDRQLALIYLEAFTDISEWTVEQHAAGLRAVFQAGAAAQRKAAPAVPGGKTNE